MTTTLADDVAASLLKSWEKLAPFIDTARTVRRGDLVELVTGIPNAELNGVWNGGIDPDVTMAEELLENVARTGMPHCLQFRPAAEDLIALAESRGMTMDEETPLMVFRADAWNGQRDEPSSLQIRKLQPGEAATHATTAAIGFGSPPNVFERLITDRYLAVSGVHCYLGEVDGLPVTTGLGVEVGSSIGIFNIATPPEYRRKGWGTAITARIVADAFAGGCTHAWLQSSQEAYGLYERMGFTTLESWPCWVSGHE